MKPDRITTLRNIARWAHTKVWYLQISSHPVSFSMRVNGYSIILLCLFSIRLTGGNSENTKANPGYLDFRIKTGMVINHHPEMWKLTDGFFQLVQIGYQRQSSGHNASSYLRNYPAYGLSYLYTGFGNSPYLGKAHAVMTFVELPIQSGTTSRQSLRIEGGVAYLTKTYDPKNNYWNRAISSPLNASINFGLNTRHQINPMTQFSAGLSMVHFSNGTIKSPNFGLNIPSLEAGLIFKLSSHEDRYFTPDTIPLRKGQQNVRFFNGIALKETVDHPGQKFMVYTLESAYTVFYNNVNQIIAGIDLTYDQSSILRIESQGYQQLKDIQQFKFGISAGHEWLFSWFHIGLHLGHYIYNRNQSDDRIYSKIALNFFITKTFYTGVILKSHYAKADFLSAGVGINL